MTAPQYLRWKLLWKIAMLAHPSLPHQDHSYCIRTDVGAYLNELLDEASALRCDLRNARAKLLSLENTKNDPEKFKHMTGLPNYNTFSVLLAYLDGKTCRLKWWRGITTMKELCTMGGGVWRPHKSERKLSIE